MSEDVIPKVLVRRRRRWLRAAFDKLVNQGGMNSAAAPTPPGQPGQYFGGQYFGREFFGKEFFG